MPAADPVAVVGMGAVGTLLGGGLAAAGQRLREPAVAGLALDLLLEATAATEPRGDSADGARSGP